MAQRLAVLFKMSEQFWMNAQLVYDLSGSHLPAKERTAITRHRTQIFRRYAQSARCKTGQSQVA